MCGVLGFIGLEQVAERLVLGAERLKNRGRQSTKIYTYNQEDSLFYKYGGLDIAPVVFKGVNLAQFPGTIGIAHTRYSTAGGSSEEKLWRNMQPVYSDKPGMVTCSNGDLVNLVSQRQRLERERGYSFDTESDAKVVQLTIRGHVNDAKLYKASNAGEYAGILFDALGKVHQDLVGAYSIVTVTQKGLLAFKDPYGIRPLCMAHRVKDGRIVEWGFASESSAFNFFGDYHDVTELEPGEAVFIDAANLDKPYISQVNGSKEAFCFFEFNYFAMPDSHFVNGTNVGIVRKRLGEIIAQEYYHQFKDRIDVLIGLPATGTPAGIGFANVFGVEYLEDAIIKIQDVRSFQEPEQEKREYAVDRKFMFVRDLIKGKRVAVIDDSNVRGTTARGFVKKLFQLGAKEVNLFYFTPEIIGPCFYGIDTPDETELVAFDGKKPDKKRDNTEIRKEIGEENWQRVTVNYISLEGMIKGIGVPRERLCLACLTRQYPTSISEALERLRLRKKERSVC